MCMPHSYMCVTEDERFSKLAVGVTYDQEGMMAFYLHSEASRRAQVAEAGPWVSRESRNVVLLMFYCS